MQAVSPPFASSNMSTSTNTLQAIEKEEAANREVRLAEMKLLGIQEEIPRLKRDYEWAVVLVKQNKLSVENAEKRLLEAKDELRAAQGRAYQLAQDAERQLIAMREKNERRLKIKNATPAEMLSLIQSDYQP